MLDVDAKKERSLAKGIIADPIQVGHPIAWSPDGKWIAFFNAGTRGFTNVAVVPAAGGEAKPVSFLANAQRQRHRVVARRHVPPLRHRPAHRGRRSSRASI